MLRSRPRLSGGIGRIPCVLTFPAEDSADPQRAPQESGCDHSQESVFPHFPPSFSSHLAPPSSCSSIHIWPCKQSSEDGVRLGEGEMEEMNYMENYLTEEEKAFMVRRFRDAVFTLVI